MKTQFNNLNDLKTKIEVGQPLYIENYINPSRSRVTQVKNKLSYFFTVLNPDDKESWIINGATEVKNYNFNFKPEQERIDIFYKNGDKPFVSLFFNETIIKGKQNINSVK